MVGDWLLVRAMLAFVALPGTVAFLIPLLLFPHSHSFDVIALSALLPGVLLLLWCVREFYVQGKGTLAPWSPPQRLVTSGPYRWSRNPMYVAVTLINAGWAWCFHAPALWIYLGVVVVAFWARVLWFEEPWAARTFGTEWESYRARVRRWL